MLLLSTAEGRTQMQNGIFVAQIGARWNYLVPRILAEGGVLSRFVTDFWCPRWVSWVLNGLNTVRWIPCRLKAVGARRDPLIPDELVSDFPWFAFKYLRRKRAARARGDIYGAYVWGGRTFCQLAARAIPRTAAAVYAFTSAGLELLRRQKIEILRSS